MKHPISPFLLSLILAATPLHAGEPPRLTVFMVGDSTMADYPLKSPSPIRGWGQMLPQYLAPNVTVMNHALCGDTTKASLQKR